MMERSLMKIQRRHILAGAAALLAGCGSDQAILSRSAAADPTSPVGPGSAGPAPRLFVINCQAGSQTGDRLVLSGVNAETVYFDDRPARSAGRITTAEFVNGWAAQGFVQDPPNAVLQIGLGAAGTSHAFELLDPFYDGSTLTFRVVQDTGQAGGPAPANFGPAALFIDDAGAVQYAYVTLTAVMPDPGGNVFVNLSGQGAPAQFSMGIPFNAATQDAAYNGQFSGSIAFTNSNINLFGFGITTWFFYIVAQSGIETVTLTAPGPFSIQLQAQNATFPLWTLSATPTVIPWNALI